MRIAYLNTYYQSNHTGGGHVHMGQFVAKAVGLGHEIWSYPGQGYPEVREIPTSRVHHIRTLRNMDALYVRVESKFPEVCTWAVPPRRQLYGFPLVVWEFNTVPESELMRGRSKTEVCKTVDRFKRYGRGCDMAICMTETLATYVRENLGIQRVLIVPNASDPELFRPDAPTVKRLLPFQDTFNIVWIGSGKEAWHDFDMIRKSAHILWERDSDSRIIFHIIGSNLVSIMGDMPPNVYYWGPEYYKKLPHWLAGMNVGLSLYRPGPADFATPLKVFDYMASGLTVVGTSQAFMKDLFKDLNQTDLLVPPGDAACLADVLLALSKDRERAQCLGLAGRQLVIDQYNWKKSVRDTMAEMETLLAERRR